ncbi:MAG: DUF1489 domain-containing protein [Rhodospirillales bacterium]|nr:DUF1489 domain-containing protein [Rhodospirillales bacterium]
MTLNLIKLAVGIDDLSHLRKRQEQRLRLNRDGAGPSRLFIQTRNKPRRAQDLLDGGSLYWVVKGLIRARQRIVGVESEVVDGTPRCVLYLDPLLVRTEPRQHRPFQGWRYLEANAAPADLGADTDNEPMPDEMFNELKTLGLL